MNGTTQPDFKEFIKLHDDQLRASGIPAHFWRRLHEKLLHEVLLYLILLLCTNNIFYRYMMLTQVL